MKDVTEVGGILTVEDLRNYKVEITDALTECEGIYFTWNAASNPTPKKRKILHINSPTNSYKQPQKTRTRRKKPTLQTENATTMLEPTQQLQPHPKNEKILQLNSSTLETEVRKNAGHFNINRSS